MSCVGPHKPSAAGARTKAPKKLHKETKHQSGSAHTPHGGSGGGKVSHGPRAKGASAAGGGTTASSFKEHLGTAHSANHSHFKRGLRG